jgi:putative hydrolase of the HAD superfamily
VAERRFKAVVLDLFDTLVTWEPARLPTLEFRGRVIRSTMPSLYPRISEALETQIELDAVMEIYHGVIEEIIAEREHGLIEVTCHERFVRTLSRLGVAGDDNLVAIAHDLRRIHMQAVRAVTSAPPQFVEAVKRIAPSYRLGLLSNFDDAETGREILADTGISHLFEAIIISADLALRKPNPLIFRRMLEMLDLEAHEILFVGDTPREDVVGARNAGIAIAWLSRGKGPISESMPTPDFVLEDLTGLPALLES